MISHDGHQTDFMVLALQGKGKCFPNTFALPCAPLLLAGGRVL
jgi:hypothetical protein